MYFISTPRHRVSGLNVVPSRVQDQLRANIHDLDKVRNTLRKLQANFALISRDSELHLRQASVAKAQYQVCMRMACGCSCFYLREFLPNHEAY